MKRGKVLHGLYLFVAALWCGEMTFFAAGGAFTVLKLATTRHNAGTINRALLDLIDLSSYAAVLVLLALLALLGQSWPRLNRALSLRLLIVAVAATFASHLIITPEMMSLRNAMGAIIDLVPKTDPLRAEWGRLHGFSSMALLLRILAAAGLFIFGFGPSVTAANLAETPKVEPLPT
ncbi:MAG: DUF4149 domain-containing protein [Thermoanaerobaculia bacterium]